MNNKDIIKKCEQTFVRARIKCKCGHTVYMASKTDYCICNWCGRKVENTRKKFKEMLKEKLR